MLGDQQFAAPRLWRVIEAVRMQKPLVHSITNLVVTNTTANVLLATGASPAMVHSLDEVERFAPQAKALVINIGTLDSKCLAAMKLAILTANSAGIPWVLDPVGAGATPYRLQAAMALGYQKPSVIRGNASEILALTYGSDGVGKGVDSVDSSEAALGAAQSLAVDRNAIVAVTGAVDYVTDGKQVIGIANGHPLMTSVTGLGCSATAVVGACLAVEPDPVVAAVAGLALFDIAGEQAAKAAQGPGSLQAGLLDVLYGLDQAVFQDALRLSLVSDCEAVIH
ncbi:MAG: hydroxyethylthiazole kinase [Candidatus Contendobacter odensis]|uniref:Hydroxyethylthiazole kinase n=1 Tax=Candidatus Contendibacter odensensis TaxID=1400860 RepID=A0A2G6PE48_9GAMM|nr:MAG: hydroxyethylthiazole kinase [Candidatus Contendobacter odensis]